jgi:hypothetical protein
MGSNTVQSIAFTDFGSLWQKLAFLRTPNPSASPAPSSPAHIAREGLETSVANLIRLLGNFVEIQPPYFAFAQTPVTADDAIVFGYKHAFGYEVSHASAPPVGRQNGLGRTGEISWAEAICYGRHFLPPRSIASLNARAKASDGPTPPG